ncbi:hypothetical protein SADFL11_00044660 [Roseibium alexandrii DFL-11]|uniref:Uncharacterized protein n=1 Tax=Roseibium alexandrii (strain DSM 17067 / NCIMB 14079 / DFL-11) TaxID=244592 RepID=A0A5E8UWY7_ROSAD|nr:hypothetical protein SADFL11_00044660 [Roseibium alexandrii DFL-11]
MLPLQYLEPLAPEALALMLMLQMLEKPQFAGSLDLRKAGPRRVQRRAPLYRLAPQLVTRRATAARSALLPVRSVSVPCQAIAVVPRRWPEPGSQPVLRPVLNLLLAPGLTEKHQLVGQKLAPLPPAPRTPALLAVAHWSLAKGSVHRSQKARRPWTVGRIER